MYKSFRIENFRCFRHLEMDDIGRVNLIVGKNNVGKTALLEALYIHDRAPDTRAIAELHSTRHGEPHEGFLSSERPEPLDELVWRFQSETAVDLVSRNETQQEKAVRIQALKHGVSLGLPKWRMTRERYELRRMLEMETTNADGVKSESDLAFDGLGFRPSEDDLPEFVSQFVGARETTGYDDQIRFSHLSDQMRSDELVEALLFLEPRLKDIKLSVGYFGTVLKGDIGIGSYVPLNAMGTGFARVTHLLLTFSSLSGTALFIDEIENGIHYSTLVDVWKAVDHISRERNVQVFATTHSYECLVAAHEAFADSEPYDLRVHRLETTKSGDLRVVTMDHETLGGVVEIGLEIR